jgi:hypothetical protein
VGEGPGAGQGAAQVGRSHRLDQDTELRIRLGGLHDIDHPDLVFRAAAGGQQRQGACRQQVFDPSVHHILLGMGFRVDRTVAKQTDRSEM